MRSLSLKKRYTFEDLVVKVRTLCKCPYMTPAEIKIYKFILEMLSAHQPLKVFEYGCGYSTLNFTRHLKNKNISFDWHGVENNASWHAQVVQMIAARNLTDFVTAVFT